MLQLGSQSSREQGSGFQKKLSVQNADRPKQIIYNSWSFSTFFTAKSPLTLGGPAQAYERAEASPSTRRQISR